MYPPDAEEFGTPVLVWTGPELLAPLWCDDLTWVVPETGAVIKPSRGFPKFLGRMVSRLEPACSRCTCTMPSCALPSDVTVFSGIMCGEEPAEARTSFAPPPGWDGACVSPGLVAPEQLGSFSIGPTREEPCVPVVEAPPVPRDFIVNEVAIACPGEVYPDLCALDDQLCLLYQPRKHLPAPWRQCVLVEGADRACEAPAAPHDPWPRFSEKLSGFYKEVRDTRRCTPCDCEPIEPSRCEALVSVYEDRACSEVPVDSARVAEDTICHDPGSGRGLGSLSATWVVNEPGSCTPTGGTLDGTLEHEGPVTICCLPEGR